MNCWVRLMFVSALGFLGVPSAGRAAGPAVDEVAAAAALDARVDQLIVRLGADDFAVRQRAQTELERIGLAAFDALHAARTHIDPEIALRAQFLVNSMRIEWTQADDSPEVKRIFREYEQRSDEERLSKADVLLRLDGAQGIRSFGRVVCFEPDDVFSKRVALLLLRSDEPELPEQRRLLGQRLRASVGRSKRAAAAWLRAYADTLENAVASLPAWQAIARAEVELFQLQPEKTSKPVVRELLSFQAALLLKHEKLAEAEQVMKRSLDLLEGQRGELLEVLHWAVDHQAWSLIDEVERRFGPQVRADARQLYCLAEAKVFRGEAAAAADLAAQAFKLSGDELDERIRVGMELQDRGQFEWAEAEYRQVFKLSTVGQPYDWQARFQLSEMLHDLLKDQAAGEVLKPAVEVMERDPNVRQFIEETLGRETGSIHSRMLYFFAEHAAARGDRVEQRKLLDQAIEHDPTDADVLIAMYRLPGADQAWKKRVGQLIAEAADNFRNEIEQFGRAANDEEGEDLGPGGVSRLLAGSCNQFAWLVGNTEGDFDEAIKASQRSLEIRPNTAGYLDTLAHAYFGKGEFAAAVKHQSHAAKLEPHSQQIRRQLVVFRAALEKSRAAAGMP